MSAPPRDRFVELFANEAESRLRRMSEHVLVLEGNASAEVVAAILRDAHSLKGAASVVGLADVSTVAHRLEDALEPFRSGSGAPSAALIDRLLAVVDGLQALLPLIRQGEDTTATTAALAAQLDTPDAVTDVPPVAAPASASAPVAPPPPPPAPPTATPVAEIIELPATRVDEIVRSVGESAATSLRLGRFLGEQLGRDPETISEYRDHTRSIRHLHEKTVRARLVPVGSITGRLHRAVRDVARARDRNVDWDASGEETELDRSVLQQLTDPLLHIVRNAVDHGIESEEERRAAGKPERAVVRFVARQVGSDVVITVSDDGRGIDGEVRDLMFESGFSTATEVSETSGRGVGLDVVRVSIEHLRGRVDVTSTPGAGTEFRITVPVTAAVLPCLLVDAGGSRFALPMASILSTQAASADTITRAQGMSRIWVGDSVVPLASLAARVGMDADDDGPIVVLADGDRLAAYQVGALVAQRDVMVTPLGPFVPQLPFVAGAAVEADGSILMVLDSGALARAVAGPMAAAVAGGSRTAEDVPRVASVLVADDALPVRELQRSILENAGYRVLVAEDGADALAALAHDRVDLVLTDVDMPRLNGFELTRAIRSDPQLANVPVVILSSKSSPEDQQEGLDAGADAYIVKDAFGEASLLSAVERLLGRAS